jgi:chromosome segregation ATPase
MSINEQERESIQKRIKLYDNEIDSINQTLNMLTRQLESLDSERSFIGGPSARHMAANIAAQEQNVQAQRNQVAARLPQLHSERDRLRAMLD